MGHKVHFCQGRGMGTKGKHDLSLGTVPPSSDQFSTTEILVQNKALRSCYTSARRHARVYTHADKVQVLLGIFCSTRCKNHNLTINSCRSINSNCRWTLATNYFQRQLKFNTTHLFRKNRINTVHLQSPIHVLHCSSLVSDFGPFWTFLKPGGSRSALDIKWQACHRFFNTESTCAKTSVW